MKAVVLAAGYATRLYPLTQNKPKCLLTVGGRSILDILLGKIAAVGGIEEIFVVTNAKFFDQLSAWKDQNRPGVPLEIFNDGTSSNETRLGAIGDLGLVLKKAQVASDVLMLASDNVFEEGLGDFIRFARSKENSVTIAVTDIGDPQLAAGKFGVIESDASSKVTRIEEKPLHPRSSRIGMGVYYFPRHSLGWVHEYLGQKSAQDAPGHYIRWLMDKTDIFSFLFSGMWYDIGDLKALEEADQRFRVRS